jgi:large subunit ribosomal protein L22
VAVSRLHPDQSPARRASLRTWCGVKTVEEALGILALTPKKASPILRKAVLSATANAQFKNDGERTTMTNSDIFIKEIRIDEGPTLKRIRPRAQGRAFRINKRTSHISVTVEANV